MTEIRGILVSALTLLFFSLSPVLASDLRLSGTNATTENPFIAYGVHPVTKVVTGYLMALRVSPERTDECKFAFAGSLKNPSAFSVKYLSELDGYDAGGSASPAAVKSIGGDVLISIKKEQMGGDCEWILPFINEPRVKEGGGEVAITFGSLTRGNWIGVFVIKSTRASFYRTTEETSVKKSFLIQGDCIYVYDEKPGWYFVRYRTGKRETIGWIRKADTIQLLD